MSNPNCASCRLIRVFPNQPGYVTGPARATPTKTSTATQPPYCPFTVNRVFARLKPSQAFRAS